MADLNLRNLDEKLIRKLKMNALASNQTLRDHCIELLKATRSQPQSTAKADALEQRGKRWSEERKVETQPAQQPEQAKPLKSCPSCGGLNGLHQKSCKASHGD